MIVFLTILSLVSGLVYGYFDVESSFISAITQNTHIVLYILMFSVGISIGMYDGIVQKIREYHIKIFIIPIGIIIGSLLGGIICSMIVKMPVFPLFSVSCCKSAHSLCLSCFDCKSAIFL